MSQRSRFRLRLQPLESRTVPASVFHYTDVDGDKVTITSSAGDLSVAGVVTVSAGQLQLLDLSGGGFDGANISFSVVKVASGDGLANVGYIDSIGHNLGAVSIKGDLGRIDAGSDSATIPAIKSLTVNSLGRLGTDTQAAGGSLESDISGTLGPITVKADVVGVFVNDTGANGKIGPISIGGSLIGGSNGDSGSIFSVGDMGAVKIGHDVEGGSGLSSGQINSDGKMASVTVGGSLIGGSDDNSGEILSLGDMGAVKIGHDVQGGSGTRSALLGSNGNLASVTIGGSVIGGSNGASGFIFSGDDMGTVKIAHNLIGGSITGSASLDNSGVITSEGGRIASVTIGGSIISGIDESTGTLTDNATIRAANDIGSLTVAGSLIGNVTANGASPVIITASGQAVQGATTDLAIGKISIGGRVEYADILAGYDPNLTPLNGDAQIGPVSVGDDWIASNLIAGAMNSASANTNFGDGNDASIGAGNPNIIAKIASITIGGQVFGTPNSTSSSDQFGFVAEQIGSLKIGGNAIALAAGPHNDNLSVGETTDVTVHEV
jgi:hypothetical protein